MKYNGGPAFPVRTIYDGMSLRDYFAGQALAGLAAHGAWDCSDGPCNSAMAEKAYLMADAMLRVKKKG